MAGFSPPMQEREISVHSLNPPVLEIAEEKRSKRNPRQLDFEAVSIYYTILLEILRTRAVIVYALRD